jgi:hypothetical protein
VNLSLSDDVASDPDPDTAPVHFRVTRVGATTPIVDASVDVKLRHQPDGCGGGGYSRAPALTKEDGLLPSVPKKVPAVWMQQLRSEATRSPRPPFRTASGMPTG